MSLVANFAVANLSTTGLKELLNNLGPALLRSVYPDFRRGGAFLCQPPARRSGLTETHCR